jgi:hypothetical protein
MKLWKIVVAALVIGALGFTVMAPALAASDAMEMDTCTHDPTVEALHMCVAHATAQGHINNVGVAQSLHAKLNAAGAALDRGSADTAVHALGAFVKQLDAQAGKHIDAQAVEHLAMHVEMVIEAIQGS